MPLVLASVLVAENKTSATLAKNPTYFLHFYQTHSHCSPSSYYHQLTRKISPTPAEYGVSLGHEKKASRGGSITKGNLK